MKRREFIAILGGAATIAWPHAFRAQQIKVARLGVLVLGAPDPQQFLSALREGLQKIGYIERQNIQLELRSAAGKASLLPATAAELVSLKVDIIVTRQTLATRAAMQATKEIPILMVGGDPVEAGIVANLARPGGNITGITGLGAVLAGKMVEVIREMLPSARRVAVLTNPASPFAKPFLAQTELAARAIGQHRPARSAFPQMRHRTPRPHGA
jgi:putative ABC transport system substrate-binding protein